MSTRCFNHDHHHPPPLLWRWRRFLFSTLLCVCWRGSKIHPRCPSYRLVLEKGFSLIPVCDGRHCHPTLNALWRISLSHLLLRRERVPVVYEIRNLQIKKVRSLSFFFVFFFFFVVERRRKVDGHFRPEVEIQKADRVDHPSDLSPLPPNQKKDEKLLSISLKITNLIDISSSLNILVLSQMTHTPVG